jgi:hypothetical protein
MRKMHIFGECAEIFRNVRGAPEFDEHANAQQLCVSFNFMIILLCYVYHMIIDNVQNFEVLTASCLTMIDSAV